LLILSIVALPLLLLVGLPPALILETVTGGTGIEGAGVAPAGSETLSLGFILRRARTARADGAYGLLFAPPILNYVILKLHHRVSVSTPYAG
jgi:hypothetical protein